LGEEKKKKAKPKAVKAKKAAKQEKKEKTDISKTKLEDLKISARTANALIEAGIKTTASLTKKKEADLTKIGGLGSKGILEIKRALGKLGLTLK